MAFRRENDAAAVWFGSPRSQCHHGRRGTLVCAHRAHHTDDARGAARSVGYNNAESPSASHLGNSGKGGNGQYGAEITKPTFFYNHASPHEECDAGGA